MDPREGDGPLRLPPERRWTDLGPLPASGILRLVLPHGAILVSGRQVLRQPMLADLMRLLRRRVRLACRARSLPGPLVDEETLLQLAGGAVVLAQSFEPHRTRRWSARRQARHPQSGVKGHWDVETASLQGVEP